MSISDARIEQLANIFHLCKQNKIKKKKNGNINNHISCNIIYVNINIRFEQLAIIYTQLDPSAILLAEFCSGDL